MADRRAGDDQLDLFPRLAPAPGEVGPARVPDHLAALAARLPPDVRLGTSSWSFPGWKDLVWDRSVDPARLARHGLAAYARHPLLRAVGVDRTYYAPVTARVYAAWASAVPEGFRFLVKAHALCTASRTLEPARREPNRLLFDAAWARDTVVAPAVDGLGAKLGVLLFQLQPESPDAFGGPARFAERLEAFLAALPRGPQYAVELRTRGLVTPAYAAALGATGAVHCVTVHPAMPEVARQAPLARRTDAPALVVRWMLAPHLGYETARDRYRPFDQLVDPDPGRRAAIAGLVAEAVARRRPALVIVNNKAEGSAPLSAFALGSAIASALEDRAR